ncbi:endo-1,4-beta-xylanase [Flavobacterium sp. 1]|uniref:glycoside hydrolase family 11 protein n=1 Tax=Flavobacterium sp. 1 TaxID=2035200 RepID=UPI000CC960FE|nr:glycoside hydrolase family 11 protein [Flavobacterium sp. 1]PJJ08674.1 endo-1,4-beta-xylanase [Flavobacterium sp. 1]
MKKNEFLKGKNGVHSLELIKKVFSLSAVFMLLLASCTEESSDSKTIDKQSTNSKYSSGFVSDKTAKNGTGTSNGFFWSLYQEGGTADLTNGSAGNFTITYSNVTDVVGGKGWNPGSARTIGYNIGVLSGSYNFVGIYGWTTSPLIEYYVSEKGSISGSTSFGTVSSDGHTYNCTKFQRVNKPSIQGTATFWQYIDNWGGASTGKNNTVTMANHIDNWKSKGGQGFGTYNYQILALEAFSGKSGSINATVW